MTNQIKDLSNPYYLHHSHFIENFLIPYELTKNNYPSWRNPMIIPLLVKNKFGFIDASILKLDDSNSILINSQIRNNNVVLLWMLNSTSKEISTSLLTLLQPWKFGRILKKGLSKLMSPKSSNYILNIQVNKRPTHYKLVFY